MTRYEPRPERAPPRRDAGGTIATLAFLVLVAALLSDCSQSATAASRQFRATVPGTVMLVIVSPPQPVTCSVPGWSILYVPTGTVYRAARWTFQPDGLVLDMTPAIDECIHIDGFES